MADQDARRRSCSGPSATKASPQFQQERGVAEEYSLTPVQADAILKMTLGQLVNLEQEKLADEHAKLLDRDRRVPARSSPTKRTSTRSSAKTARESHRKHADERRTEISGEEIGEVDLEDLIEEETMVVSISHNGYIKRTPVERLPRPAPRRQGHQGRRRPTKTIRSSTSSSPARTTTCCSSPTRARSTGRRSTTCRQLRRESKGRAVVNLLNLAEGEKIADCRAVRDFDQPGPLPDDGHAQRPGEEDRAQGLQPPDEERHHRHQAPRRRRAGRRRHHQARRRSRSSPPPPAWRSASARADARPMGRNTSGVKGITSARTTTLVGMVVADPDATLLTACQNGYGKRTPFGPNAAPQAMPLPDDDGEAASASRGSCRRRLRSRSRRRRNQLLGFRYRTQNRGGKGLRDIKTTDRNGPVIGIVRVDDTRRTADDDRPRQDPARSPSPTSAPSAATRKASASCRSTKATPSPPSSASRRKRRRPPKKKSPPPANSQVNRAQYLPRYLAPGDSAVSAAERPGLLFLRTQPPCYNPPGASK